jgi:hypothetical protein
MLDVSKIIQCVYLQNMKTNPWFEKYKTIFEQSNDYVSMCFFILRCYRWHCQ